MLFYDTARFLHGILSVFRRHLLKHCTGHSCKRFHLRETLFKTLLGTPPRDSVCLMETLFYNTYPDSCKGFHLS